MQFNLIKVMMQLYHNWYIIGMQKVLFNQQSKFQMNLFSPLKVYQFSNQLEEGISPTQAFINPYCH